MNNRTLKLTSLVCYIGASILVAAALFDFTVHELDVNLGWFLFASSCAMALIGVLTSNAESETSELITRTQSQVDLLRAEMDQRQNAVDVLADGLDIAIFICDAKANILYANRRAAEMFNFPDPVGRTILAVTLSHDLEQLVFDTWREETAHNGELGFTYPDERVGLAKAWPQMDSQRVFLSIYEITDLRRLERIRQDFVSNVSHELRTPLTIIRAMAETLLDDPESSVETREKYLEKIVNEVDRLSLIANDLLILSAAESNTAKKNACDIADVFRGAVQQLKTKAKEKGLKLDYSGPDRLVVEANGTQMTQVALNLVDNAINYTTMGSVSVCVKQQDGFAEIAVKDTGIGIGSEHQPRIFERFYRVDKGRSRATGGTGLGLSIVKHIVEAHGGRVTVESALNQGSTFTVHLPIGNPVEE